VHPAHVSPPTQWTSLAQRPNPTSSANRLGHECQPGGGCATTLGLPARDSEVLEHPKPPGLPRCHRPPRVLPSPPAGSPASSHQPSARLPAHPPVAPLVRRRHPPHNASRPPVRRARSVARGGGLIHGTLAPQPCPCAKPPSRDHRPHSPSTDVTQASARSHQIPHEWPHRCGRRPASANGGSANHAVRATNLRCRIAQLQQGNWRLADCHAARCR